MIKSDLEGVGFDLDQMMEEIEESSRIVPLKQQHIKGFVKDYSMANKEIFKDFEEQETKKKGNDSYRPHFNNYKERNYLCKSVYHLPPGSKFTQDMCTNPKCHFSHDVEEYLTNKVQDLAGECHNYSTMGYCSSGVTCRFGHNHVEDFGYKPDQNKFQSTDEESPFVNFCRKNVKTELTNGTYNFKQAEKAIQESDAELKEWRETHFGKPEVGDEVAPEKKIGPVSDEDLIPLRPVEKKRIEWAGKTYLAPLTGLGGIPFRRICKSFGVDITCSEMIDAAQLIKPAVLDWTLAKRHKSEDCFGIQLSGTRAEDFIKAAQLLTETCQLDFIDINMDCPSISLFRKGGGTKMMYRPITLQRIVRGINKISGLPITLKMKTGHEREKKFAHELIDKLNTLDIDMITVHGRSKEQKFRDLANWDYINTCSDAARSIPVFGNGDVFTFEDYNQRLSDDKVEGVMIGRAALMKPWIFTEIKEQRHWDITATERFAILQDYVKYCFEAYGTDYAGIERTRACVLEWMNYFHRYVPLGLLERPMKIYQKPLPYTGRNDLETLMASPRLQDWIKLSTTLLGRVPNGFNYIPISGHWY